MFYCPPPPRPPLRTPPAPPRAPRLRRHERLVFPRRRATRAERRLPHRPRRPRRRAEAPRAAEHERAGDEQRHHERHDGRARGGGLEQRARPADRAEAEQRADEAAEEVGAAAEERCVAVRRRRKRVRLGVDAQRDGSLGDQRHPRRRKGEPKAHVEVPLELRRQQRQLRRADEQLAEAPRRREREALGRRARRPRPCRNGARAQLARQGAELDALADEERRDHGEPRRRVAGLQPRAEQQLEEQQQQRAGEDAVHRRQQRARRVRL